MQVGSVELERAVVEHVPSVEEAAAVSVPPAGGGPEELHLFLVLHEGSQSMLAETKGQALHRACQAAIRKHLNPLFKIQEVHVCTSLPRNASNKVMRRMLRAQAGAARGVPKL
jgi:acyl-coenzyme A synthetase/AMP-(fatty) acid ligase